MDMNLFDLTGVELVKKKYYNAAKVSEIMGNAREEYLKPVPRMQSSGPSWRPSAPRKTR